MGEGGQGVVQRGDVVVVIVFICIVGAMVWVAPTLPCLEADHVRLGVVVFEFRSIFVFRGERLVFQNGGGI